ncbi:MAG: CehA/McbA family metallohydrolase [Deltaproteobacteria bacterium]|nr:CehA/McbA family metallohydrolase [Deltaproteobacteria bacterium]MBN2674169.1 CehA/McbA family metallohydrolase [Deltaproteobacteria bacterium]
MTDIFVPQNIWKMDGPGYGRDPRLCTDALGRSWVVWICYVDHQECLYASYYIPGQTWCPSFPVTSLREYVTSFDLTAWNDGVLVGWIDGAHPERDGLKICAVHDLHQHSEPLLILPKRRSPVTVSLASEGDRFFLAWSSRRPGGHEIQGVISDSLKEIPPPMQLSERKRMNLEPAVELSNGHAWVAWQYMTFRGGSRVFVRRIENGETLCEPLELVGPDGSLNAMCTLKRGSQGVWIAWQSDMDPLSGPGLVRWVEVGYLDVQGRFHQPSHKMPDVQRQAAGEDQGFEFPSLVACDDGRLVIFGRGSQSLRRQDLTPDGWTERGQVDPEGWQCRGVYDAALATEGILVAGREKSKIVVRLLPVGEQQTPEKVVSISQRLDLSRSAKGVRVLGRRVLFGDIHQHTAASDGTGTLAETYNRARYRYGDDLVAVSDHESFLGRRTTPGEWAQYCATADDFYEPGEFVTLYAYEWTGSMHPGPGHKVVYPPSADFNMLFSRDNDHTQTSAGLIAEAKRVGALVFPHHVGWTGADMENHDEDVQTCFEIVSCHGAYERMGMEQIGTRGDDKEGQFVADALDRGLRFGLIGGSDGHGLNWHHGVCRMEDSHRSGLTAVLTDELTREGVLDALSQRRCYATSGARICLWFEIDGRPMGSTVRPGGISSFRVVANGTDRIQSVCLVSNRGKEIPLKHLSTLRDVDIHGTLPPPAEGGWSYYFVRVVQEDGHMAWSSPIWVESFFSPVDDRMIG